MKITARALLTTLFFCLTLLGQQKKPSIIAEGTDLPEERGSTRILYWDQTRNGAVGQVAIDYGRPVWKAEYDDAARFGQMTKGKVWRLGKDFWTVLDTSLALKIASVEVPVGAWYLGLHRSADGKQWSLAFLQPAKIRAARLDAFEIARAPIAFQIPLDTVASDRLVQKLTITLARSKDTLAKSTLDISWGKLKVTAPVEARLGK